MKANTPRISSAAKTLLRAIALSGASSLVASTSFGAEITKAANSDAMSLVSSWTSGIVPSTTDVALWGPGLSTGAAAALGANTGWLGLKVSGNPSSMRLGAIGDAAFTLTFGASGVDLSAATSGSYVSIDGPKLGFLSGVQQTWSVADGVLFDTYGTLTANAGAIVKFDLGATGNGLVAFNGLAAVNSLIGGFAVIGNDFAAVDSNYYVKPGASLGIYQTNPAPDATTVSPVPTATPGNLMDFTVTTTSDGSLPLQGMSAPNVSWFMQGFRFNVPSARTDVNQWTINMGNSANSARTITPSVGVVVGPGVGTSNVVFSGTGTIRVPNATGTNRLALVQNNPQGDLIFTNGGGIGAQTAATATIVKSGVGRVIIAAPVFANNGLYIHEGTVQFGNGGVVGAPGTGVIVNKGALVIDRSDAVSIASVISGTGSLTKNSAGALTLSGANTYTGATTINGGSIVLSTAGALGVTSSLILNGGGITYGTGVTQDVSSAPVTLSGGTNTINTNGNNVTLAQSIGQGGTGSLVKAGAGKLTFSSSNNYSGSTSVSAGTLAANNSSGSATGSGPVNVSSGATLTGSGTIAGAVTASTGAIVAPGNAGIGTLTMGSLNLAANSINDFEFTSVSSYDKIVTTGSNGLTVNGGGLHLYSAGGTSPYSTPGTYNLVQFSGVIQGTGPSSLSVLNPQAGYAYTFGTNGSFLTLLIELDAILSQWTSTGAGSWGSASNWGNGVPTTNYTAQLTTSLAAPATITLDGNRTINGLVLQSANAYTIAQGTSGTLTIDKGAKSAAVNVLLGQHTISAPVALVSNIAVSTDAGTGLTLSGSVSGPGGITKTGAGFLDLTGNNSFTGAINVVGGVLGFGQSTSLGSGSLTLNGGTLRYDTGNTSDISSRTLTVGQDGATIDTNGNDVIWLNAIGNGGHGSLTKTGAGILALAGANTHTGGTVVAGGTLLITDNAQLGDTTAALTFNGGTFASGASFNLQLAGTTPVNRPVVVGANGGSFQVSSGQTLGVNGVLSGNGVLAKDGAGTLTLTDVNSTKTGGFTLRAGTLNLGADISFIGTAALVGAGTLTLEGGTLTTINTQNNSWLINNAVNVPAGKTAAITTPNRFALSGAVSGAGTLNMSINTTVSRADLSNDFSAYTGTLNLTGTGTVRLLNNGGGFNTAGLVGTSVSASSGLTLAAATNSGGNAFQIGSLSGSATLTNSNGGIANYQIGARNETTTFSGNFVHGVAANSVTKVGTGTLTLDGAALHDGLTTVSAGTLLIDSTVPASVATVPILPLRVVTVAAAGTLGGLGTITPDTVVNGTLRTDSTGARGGKLTFGGVLEFASTATAQFDFGGTAFTGVKSTLTGGVTYGGALKLNFLGSLYNGSYTLFELTGSPVGAFSGVSAVTPVTTAGAALTESSGVWTGTVDGATLTFTASTGVLTITGGLTAVLPATPTGVAATASSGSVALSWSAAANASTYLVKRSTTTGGPYTTVAGAVATTAYSDTGLTNGTTYYYVIQAKNGAGLSANSAEVSATPAAVVLSGLQNWRQTYFNTTANSGNAADSADPDADGIPNLIEYATGRNPTQADSTPVLTVTKVGDFLTVTFNKIADTNITYTVQGTSDLAGTPTWATIATSTGTAAGSTTVTDTQALSSNPRRFLRLSVSYTTP